MSLRIVRHFKNEKGETHREDGPAIIYSNGDCEWFLNGQPHRTGGPAIEDHSSGYKAWFNNGELHRLDGPAIEWTDGDGSWAINGVCYTEEEFNEYISKMLPQETRQLTL